MKYWISYDTMWDSKIEKLFDPIEKELAAFLETKKYGEEVDELRNIIMCNEVAKYGFKKRSKFSRKDRYIYFDVYVDYEVYMLKSEEEKKKMIAECFLNDIDLLSKCKPKGFNIVEFKNDFASFFKGINWL